MHVDRKVLNGIEHVHRFTRAVSVGIPWEFFNAEKEDQKLVEACKRPIKNCIVCWDYLYLSQQFAALDYPAKREDFIQALRHGSAAQLVTQTPVELYVPLLEFNHSRLIPIPKTSRKDSEHATVDPME